MTSPKSLFEELSQDAPLPVPVPERIRVGQRALRRRRLRVGAAALGALVAVGATGWTFVEVGQHESRPDYSSDPVVRGPMETPSDIAIGSHEELAEHSGEGVFYDERSGELARDPDAVVTGQVTDPIPTEATKSVALEVDYRGVTRWMYLYWSSTAGGSSYALPEEGVLFDDWVVDLRPEELIHQSMWQVADETSGAPSRGPGGTTGPS